MTLRVFALLLLTLISGSLQGCFPVVATGVGAGVMLAQDRRTKDAIFDDQTIETTAAERIDDQLKSVMHVNVTSYNHNVLISGEVPDEQTKMEIEKIVSSIDKVQVVYNELAVSGASSLVSRSNDALITSNVKLRFVNDDRFNADHIKVVTENGAVYLMGLVKHEEADAASDVTSTTQGVRRVIRLFEYLD
jgi:osmotically-inducible protein OsmY